MSLEPSTSDIPIQGYDNRGAVFFRGNFVVRKVDSSYLDPANDILRGVKADDLFNLGIVKTEYLGDATFRHERHVISYPWEWPVEMIYKAIIFHLDLFIQLSSRGLTFKDFQLNNVVFDGTKPVFVDFLSLVKTSDLKNEAWLASQNSDARFDVFKKMFRPYVLQPWLLFVRKDFKAAREALKHRSCNNRTAPLSASETLSIKNVVGPRSLWLFFQAVSIYILERVSFVILKNLPGGFGVYCRLLKAFITWTRPINKSNGYARYYSAKSEDTSFQNVEAFNPKQKSVYELLQKKPKSVLDLGANTGWFSILAAKGGARVIGVEAEESSASTFYENIKDADMTILPLKATFQSLDDEIFGQQGGHHDSIPLGLSGLTRFQSEDILALGLVHHLVLGCGISIENVFQKLNVLAQSRVIMEFVGFDDELVQKHPDFFPNIHEFNANSYNLEKFKSTGLQFFAKCEVKESFPQNRKILVFSR